MEPADKNADQKIDKIEMSNQTSKEDEELKLELVLATQSTNPLNTSLNSPDSM